MEEAVNLYLGFPQFIWEGIFRKRGVGVGVGRGVVRMGTKRIFDMVPAALGLMVLSPLLLAVAVVVRLHMGSPVLFRQERPGCGGKPFTIYKFRTMKDMWDAQGNPLPDAVRLNSQGDGSRGRYRDSSGMRQAGALRRDGGSGLAFRKEPGICFGSFSLGRQESGQA